LLIEHHNRSRLTEEVMLSRSMQTGVRVAISMRVIMMARVARDKITVTLKISITKDSRLTRMDMETRVTSVLKEVMMIRNGTKRSRDEAVRGVETDEVDADADDFRGEVVRARKSSEQRSAQRRESKQERGSVDQARHLALFPYYNMYSHIAIFERLLSV
jgi:hypothetical protein